MPWAALVTFCWIVSRVRKCEARYNAGWLHAANHSITRMPPRLGVLSYRHPLTVGHFFMHRRPKRKIRVVSQHRGRVS